MRADDDIAFQALTSGHIDGEGGQVCAAYTQLPGPPFDLIAPFLVKRPLSVDRRQEAGDTFVSQWPKTEVTRHPRFGRDWVKSTSRNDAFDMTSLYHPSDGTEELKAPASAAKSR
jgi:hypothetical protein